MEADPPHVSVIGDQGESVMPVGAEGPRARFGDELPVGEMIIPSVIRFDGLPPSRDFPDLALLAPEDLLYAGRIPDSTIDVVLFDFDAGEGSQTGIYAFDSGLFIVFDYVSEASPGYGRTTVWDSERGEADMVCWAPLGSEVAVVTLIVEGERHTAMRPRAGLAAFDTADVPDDAHLRLLARDSEGRELQTVDW